MHGSNGKRQKEETVGDEGQEWVRVKLPLCRVMLLPRLRKYLVCTDKSREDRWKLARKGLARTGNGGHNEVQTIILFPRIELFQTKNLFPIRVRMKPMRFYVFAFMQICGSVCLPNIHSHQSQNRSESNLGFVSLWPLVLSKAPPTNLVINTTSSYSPRFTGSVPSFAFAFFAYLLTFFGWSVLLFVSANSTTKLCKLSFTSVLQITKVNVFLLSFCTFSYTQIKNMAVKNITVRMLHEI